MIALLAGAAALGEEDGAPSADKPTFNFSFPSRADLDWHERFTLGDLDEWPSFFLDDDIRGRDSVEFATGEKWGLTLSFDGNDAALDLEGLRAGAFLNITPRMRIGGQLSFSNPEERLIPGGESEADAPEVKLESAFRF